ncbi:PIR protein [Plasmodium ovale]|uniref:PIR protein n=1 Tax=Plasmodium ovale TaxID=36330 RepID=A0A1C3KI65_PLAOA|nr:PIR protein [Plasmodium ovale]
MVTKESDLPSYKTYELLSNENGNLGNLGNFSDKCHSLQGKFRSYDKIFGLCTKLAGNLVNFCSSNENRSPLNYNCEFIHQWLFNEIINNLGLHDNGPRQGVKGIFYSTWENIVSEIKCTNKCDPNLELFQSSTIDDLKFRKNMHDYIYNYDILDKMDSSTEKIDNRYCKYLSSMNEKYTEFKDFCPHNNKKCFHGAKSLEEYNPENLCTKFRCRDEPLCSKYIGDTSTKSDRVEARSLEKAELPDDRDGEYVASVNESETSTILTTVGPSFLGLFITSFFLFKLTPMRSWFNNRILKRKNIEEYINEEASSEIIDNYFLHENREPGKSGYDIAYHSVVNIGD